LNESHKQALLEATARRRMAEQADNAIEQCRFDKLIDSGMIEVEVK